MAAARQAASRWDPAAVSQAAARPAPAAQQRPDPGLSWHLDRMGRRIPWSVWRSTPMRVARFVRAIGLIGIVLIVVVVLSNGASVGNILFGGGFGPAKGGSGVQQTGGAPPANDCADGYTWRLVVPGDHVCVTLATAQQVVADDAPSVQSQRTRPNGFCVQGYVWREAVPNDHVCVLPSTRAQAASDNTVHDHKAGQ